MSITANVDITYTPILSRILTDPYKTKTASISASLFLVDGVQGYMDLNHLLKQKCILEIRQELEWKGIGIYHEAFKYT